MFCPRTWYNTILLIHTVAINNNSTVGLFRFFFSGIHHFFFFHVILSELSSPPFGLCRRDGRLLVAAT